MPLSEHEQRQLEQIERALYAEDPKFAQAVRAKDPRVHYKRRIVEAAIGFLLGVGLLLAGVVSKLTVVGVAGFVVMLACSMWALSSWRHMSGGATAGRGPARERGPGTAGPAGPRLPDPVHGTPGRALAPPPGARAVTFGAALLLCASRGALKPPRFPRRSGRSFLASSLLSPVGGAPPSARRLPLVACRSCLAPRSSVQSRDRPVAGRRRALGAGWRAGRVAIRPAPSTAPTALKFQPWPPADIRHHMNETVMRSGPRD